MISYVDEGSGGNKLMFIKYYQRTRQLKDHVHHLSSNSYSLMIGCYIKLNS